MPDQAAIGFVGIGAMGWPMAANLVRRQFPVTVYDLDRARQDRFVQAHQSRAASSLADLGKDIAVDRHHAADRARRARGAADRRGWRARERAQAGRDRRRHEFVRPGGHARACGASLAKRGVILVDAPVSGGTRGAEAASLTIMIGSDDKAAVERVRPVLEAMGQRLFETGGSGTGHAMKALNNFIAGTNFLAAAEALVVGEALRARSGADDRHHQSVDRPQFLDRACASAAGAQPQVRLGLPARPARQGRQDRRRPRRRLAGARAGRAD